MLSRRALLASAVGLGLAATAARDAAAAPASRRTRPFPQDFLWGAATAAHQVEGNNVNSESWVVENVKPTIYVEPSGDACDHYHRYAEDIALLASLGFNTYRFSLEWARIEPEPGAYSLAELDHYRRMLAACHEHHVTPVVTFNHFTVPRWFAAQGGWENPAAADPFVRYCERAARHLGDLIGVATTFNEPNLSRLLGWIPAIRELQPQVQVMLAAAARAVGSDRFSIVQFADPARTEPIMLAAHARAYAAIKGARGSFPVGVSLAIQDEQAVGAHSVRDAKRQEIYVPWLEAAAGSDFVGIQTYTRARVGESGDLGPEPGVELTDMWYEFWPEALGATIRYAAAATKKPVYVTESGHGGDDDARRVEYIRRALLGVEQCLAEGIDVRGYLYWSLLDNFEWSFGYRPHFGLIAVDRQTFKRTPKPSASYLGAIARRNRL
jgi:beta-glucosidase